jgi:peroxiredoxin
MKKFVIFLTAALMQTLLMYGGEPYKTGDVVSDLSLKNVKGEMVSFSQFKDAKGFIVVFSCNTCPVVMKYQQRIIDLNDQFSSKGYPVIEINSNDKSVSPGDSFEAMQKYAKSKGFTFQYLYDESQDIARQWGATNTPHAYVLSKNDGKLMLNYVGAIDNNADDPDHADKKYVEDAVNALLKSEQVAVKSTKAVGCTIKWKRG